MIHAVSRPKKRLFVALILASLVLAALSTYGIWMVSVPGLANISRYLPIMLGCLFAAVILGIFCGVVGIILAIMGIRTLPIFQGLAWSAINFLFPLAIQVGKLLDFEKERVERSFIEVSNHLIKQKKVKVPPEKVLILSPHCIQLDSCPHKITRDVNNCHRCGGCPVGELLDLSKELKVQLVIVTGGTLARNVIKALRPKAILAIACERDLTSGIQDVFPLPVVGILNERPNGPCCNTKVDIVEVRKAVLDFIK
ncbi:MAG: DUF116 domain-containing protein [Pelosinus sp.]|nr:DUF116 domain-containing protein [Pelosinus sp.]